MPVHKDSIDIYSLQILDLILNELYYFRKLHHSNMGKY